MPAWRAQDDLRRSEATLRRVIESLGVGVIMQDADAEIVSANARALELFGVSRSELVGRRTDDPTWNVVREDGSAFPTAQRPMALARATRQPVREVLMGLWRAGSADRAWLLVNAVPELDEAGEVVRVVGTYEDVSERRRLEEALVQAQKMDNIGQLAGGLAHDFNNLLMVISSCATLALRRVPPGSPERGEIDQIVQASERAAALTSQLLAVARRQVTAAQIVDVNTIIGAMHPLLASVVGRTVELEVRGAAGLWPVRVDPGQLEQVLTNLAVNARDAMPHGGHLLLRTQNCSLGAGAAPAGGDPGHGVIAPGDYVTLSVSDTGMGMDEAIRGHLFEPFFTTKGPGRGTGLGLTTVLGIVRQSHGHVRVDSATGKGTTFTIYLPRADAARTGTGGPATASVEARDAAAGRETVLVVEDEEQLLALLAELLEEQGYRVLAARDGAEALLLARGHDGPIDLLLTDMVMGGLGGESLADRLAGERPATRVLFVSGYTGNVLRKLSQLGPGQAFLRKPFDAGELLMKVRELLARPR